MRPIPDDLKERIIARPQHGKCFRRLVLKDHECQGRITWEHVFLYGGRQINELWAIIELCDLAHSTGLYQDCGIIEKKINEWISINLMSPEDEARYPRFSWRQRRYYLNSLYGTMNL
jgi:hypothetical protein